MRIFASLVLLLSLPAFAQNQQEAEITLKSFTKLVQVPVVVTDKSGRAITNLSKDDFVLFENGKPVPIAIFEPVNATNSAPLAARPEASTTSGIYSNHQAGRPEHRPIVILVIDAINTPFFDQAQHRRQLLKFLSEKIESGTLLSLMVLTRSGLRSIHEYTTDPKILIAALQRAQGIVGGASEGDTAALAQSQVPIVYSPYDAAMVQQQAAQIASLFSTQDPYFGPVQRAVSMDLTLNALRSIAQMYAGVPGRKALVWTAGGFPHFSDDLRRASSTDLGIKYFKTMDELGDASVSIYPIDAAGLIGYSAGRVETSPPNVIGGPRGPSRDPGLLSGQGDTAIGSLGTNSAMVDRMKDLAENTGGVPYYGTNDLNGAIRKAVNDSSNYYLLGYYLRGGDKLQVERRVLKVQVKRGGVKVRHRARAYITPQNADPRREMIMAQISPLEFTMLPLQVRFDHKQMIEGRIPFEIAIDTAQIELHQPEQGINLDVVVIARSPEGNLLDMVNQTLTGTIKDVESFRQKPFAYSNRLRALNGPATVRFIVRDNNSGKMGSVIVEAN